MCILIHECLFMYIFKENICLWLFGGYILTFTLQHFRNILDNQSVVPHTYAIGVGLKKLNCHLSLFMQMQQTNFKIFYGHDYFVEFV